MNNPIRIARQAVAIADAASVADIEAFGTVTVICGRRWYDIRPMLCPLEHSAHWIDLAEIGIAYAVARQLVARHPTAPHLVRLTRDQPPAMKAGNA